MARKRADEDRDEIAEDAAVDTVEDAADDIDAAAEDDEPERTDEVEDFWSKLEIEPVEIALPVGVGYTLRAYRMSDQLEPDDDDSDDDSDDELDEAAKAAEAELASAKSAKSGKGKADKAAKSDKSAKSSDDDEDDDKIGDKGGDKGKKKTAAKDDDADSDDLDDDLDDADEEAAELEVDEEEIVVEPEEVPIFLARRGNVILFRSRRGLVDFVRSDEPHDLEQLEAWPEVVKTLEVSHLAPADEDQYELDLVVDNLRGGHAVWDAELVISAGEVARDLGYALRLSPVLTALSAGSPLDDLDDALRRTVDGGVGGFMAKRRARKIGTETAALAWRTIIGKISSAVDWRD